ncbi:MAG: threonine ammonia-lyase, biosynthetic [Gammaproteobacteria bacterium]|nr:MAG: threonine ammonia-lyase, biosynthetic [Gammaproteobacteria bacterium]
MFDEYIEKIKNARVYDVAVRSPLEPLGILSGRYDNKIFLKREDLQAVFSFKLRGAYNKMVNLAPDQVKQGVIAASAGNHAQGVALAAQRLSLRALIVMPLTTPQIKIDAVVRLGAEVVLHGNNYDEAYDHAKVLSGEKHMCFVHPYDDPEVIAGQGTVAVEVLEQLDAPPHAVFVPVGGGGLIAGMALWIKHHHPEVRVIGVEPEDAPSMHDALAANERVLLDHVGIFTDGVAVRRAGKEPFRIAKELVDEMILVTTDEVCAAIKDIYDDTRSIAEPAGALGIAGLKKYIERESCHDRQFVAVNSGANINFDRLRHVSERADIGERLEALVAVTIPEKAGSFRVFCEVIGQRGITEFNYRYFDDLEAHVFAGVQLRGGDSEREELIASLREKGYPVIDMTENEMAKLHIRYMVGGRAAGVANELLYRFEFPERPGALLHFLNRMSADWNISLFHYRNHGADYGRVLVGIQVPVEERDAFQLFLDGLGYVYEEESNNPAYALFLGG